MIDERQDVRVSNLEEELERAVRAEAVANERGRASELRMAEITAQLLEWRSNSMRLDELERERVALLREAAAAQERAASVAAEASSLRSQLAELRDEIERARAEVDALRSSRSWRLTSPLRWTKLIGRRVIQAGPRQ